MFDAIAQNYLTGNSPPQSVSSAPAWTKGLTSDQQLARYWQMLQQVQVPQVAADTSGANAGTDPGSQALPGATAANQTDFDRNAAFEKTLSPEDLANYLALSKQHSDNVNHAANNGGIMSLLAPLAVYGAYGAAGAGAAGTGGGELATAGAESLPVAESGVAPTLASGGGELGADGFLQASGSGIPDSMYEGGAGLTEGGGGGAAGGGGSSPGFWSSAANGNWGDAGTAAGNYLTSGSGIQTLGGLASSLLQSKQAGNALAAQTNATNSANALQKYMYDTTRADYAPYRAAGTQAVGSLTNLLANPGSITSDPGYQFGLNQGQTSIDRSAASKGSLYSGATLKALDRYGQDYGGTKLNDAFNRYASVAQLGATGTAGTAQAGMNYANQVGANATGLGNAAAGNALYNGTVWGNALNSATSAYKNYQQPPVQPQP